MRWLAMLTLVAGLAVVAGFGSGSRPRIPSARFEGAGASCPRPAGFMPRVVPAKGRPGSAITLTGALPLWNASGATARPAVRELEVWWNLSPSDWLSVAGGEPAPVTARPGSARRELRALVPVTTACVYQLVFRVPRVAAGTYPVDVLYRTAAGVANLPAVTFVVTR